jgi:hypothetical protein
LQAAVVLVSTQAAALVDYLLSLHNLYQLIVIQLLSELVDHLHQATQ